MKKNIVKTMLKAAATTAMVAAMFVGGNKMEAKACPSGCILPNGNCICNECYYKETGLDALQPENSYAYEIWCSEKEGYTGAAAVARKQEIDNIMIGIAYGESNMDIKSHNSMLKLVNKDRKANGAGNLTWNADLEVVARQRAYEVYLNAQSAEYATALNTGDYEKQCELVHAGSREDLGENAIVSFYSGVKDETANQNWIASEGHHVVRINAGYTQYAAASYTDPLTGVETWVEVFQ